MDDTDQGSKLNPGQMNDINDGSSVGGGDGGERIFDISPDLNISLVKDEPAGQDPAALAGPAVPEPVVPEPAMLKPAVIEPAAPVPAATGEPLVPKEAPSAPPNLPVGEADMPAPHAQETAVPGASPSGPDGDRPNPLDYSPSKGQDWPFSFKGHDLRTGDRQATVIPAKGTTPLSNGFRPPAGVEATKPVAKTEQPAAPIAPKPVYDLPPLRKAQPTKPISPTVTPISPAKASSSNLRPIRTYESDAAEALSHKGSSAASIAIAENRRRGGSERLANAETGEADSHGSAGKKIFMLLMSLIIIGAGLIGAYLLYSKSPLANDGGAPAQNQTQAPSSLVPADSMALLPIAGLSRDSVLAAIRKEASKQQAPGTIEEIIPVKAENGSTVRATASDMASIMEIPAPDMILRTLMPQWMLGIYAAADGSKSAFVIVKTDFFQNAFAGMLQWESTMADDIRQYVYPTPLYDIANVPAGQAPYQAPVLSGSSSAPLASSASTSLASSSQDSLSASSSATASSSPTYQTSQTVPVFPAIRGSFKDEIVKNKDVRAFVSDTGQTLFVYSFIDDSTLVVAGSDQALAEIITRLENQAFVR